MQAANQGKRFASALEVILKRVCEDFRRCRFTDADFKGFFFTWILSFESKGKKTREG